MINTSFCKTVLWFSHQSIRAVTLPEYLFDVSLVVNCLTLFEVDIYYKDT